MAVAPMSFVARLGWAVVCLLRVLVDGGFVARTYAVRDRLPELPEPSEPEPPEPASEPASEPEAASEPEPAPAEAAPAEPRERTGALELLALFQREGRLVDFLQQEVEAFDDADIGAAARVVHAGCRKVLARHAEVEPVRPEEEESRVTVEDGIATGAVKLVGDVKGKPPFRGTLRHRGWRVRLTLPEPTAGHDTSIVAPAEVEL